MESVLKENVGDSKMIQTRVRKTPVESDFEMKHRKEQNE
jgi:hypothetical protein